MFKKIFYFFVFAFLGLIAVILFNTFTFESKQLDVPKAEAVEFPETSLQHFRQAIQFKTISWEDTAMFDPEPFLQLHQFLAATYPLADSLLEKTVVNDLSLLYEWKGSDPLLKPIVLMGHMDVVPIEKPQDQIEFERRVGKLKSEMYSTWEVPPFAGEMKDGYVWGRGTIDDKVSVIGNLEAVERLLQEGFQPKRTVYFAFGHDEEIGGVKGAKAIVDILKAKNVVPEFVMDEGGIITKEKVPGLLVPVALVGTAEKGFVTIELTINLPGGHSSMPQKETSIEVLAKAILALRENQFPTEITPPVQAFLDRIGPEMPFGQKMVFANLWLFEGVIKGIYEGSPAGNASVRTTTSPTIFNSGFKANVLPSEAKAIVNFRVLPGQSSEEVMARVKEVIADDRIGLAFSGKIDEATQVSPINSFGYEVITKTIRQHFDETIVTPYLVVGATDARYYYELTDNVYRFMPVTDPIGFHDINERISVDSYYQALNYYYNLIKNSSE
ncbi:M20 family peptidase [Flammeovirgaceae bacterium SG7u.111]|nr:M20 family peptidase [Flammeovirgaceae bacterium SG7u.132]WPO35844.1 M20 family peptidase [Flammeovirgaceae bacterium SG7u.111]